MPQHTCFLVRKLLCVRLVSETEAYRAERSEHEAESGSRVLSIFESVGREKYLVTCDDKKTVRLEQIFDLGEASP